ncbi:hypothetical protein Tco_1459885, partial [Tanacetum coccineum]
MLMRTLAYVEIEIMLILGFPCCLSSSSVRCLKSDVYPVFVDPEIRHAYLDGTDTKSEPFEDLIDIETPESPLTVAPPISLYESAPPVLVPILRRTTRMAVRVPLAMSSCLSISMAEVAAMFESAFLETSEEDDDEEEEEIEDSLDSNSVSEDAENEGPTVEDEDPAAGDEGLAAGVEGPSMVDEKEEEEAVPGDQQQAAPVVGTVMSAPLGLGYGALRFRELTLEEDHVYSTFEVGQGSGSAPEFERPERVSASRQPTLTTWIDPEDNLAAGDEGLTAGLESLGMDDESYSLDDNGHGVESDGLGLEEEEEEEEAVPRGQQQASSVVGTTVSAPLGLGYRALRRQELALEEDNVYSTFEVGQGSGSAPEFERPERVSASRQPTLTTWIDPE